MHTKYLTEPQNRNVVAQLSFEPEIELNILDEKLRYKFTLNGITVERKFKEEHKLREWSVFPSDGKLFALAFEQFFKPRSPAGYVWLSKKELDELNEWKKLSDEKLAKLILEDFMTNQDYRTSE